jgi:hypothetical protein
MNSTTARRISARFGDDGQRWTDDTGLGLLDVCQDDLTASHSRDGGLVRRYHFGDGSAIVVAGDGWDLGITGEDRERCTCWSDDGVTCREPDNCGCLHCRHEASS